MSDGNQLAETMFSRVLRFIHSLPFFLMLLKIGESHVVVTKFRMYVLCMCILLCIYKNFLIILLTSKYFRQHFD